jgi:hypothetical protein
MSKIKVVINTDEYTTFRCYYLRPILDEYLQYTEYNESDSYEKSNTVFVTKSPNSEWVQKYRLLGYKVAVDNLWEQKSSFKKTHPNYKGYVINCSNFFWYNESLWYTALGYDKYKPNKNYSKLALLPINIPKLHREQLIKLLKPKLDQLIYSNTSKGIYLPGDKDSSDIEWQRYFNPDWYDSTYFSIVAETTVTTGDIFVTEKTFKPIAYYHPFIILGQPGILKRIQQLGFETFDNIFDESYDNLVNFSDRLININDTIDKFIRAPYDVLTLEKIEHNHNLFFNYIIVKNGIIEKIINPLLEFVNA